LAKKKIFTAIVVSFIATVFLAAPARASGEADVPIRIAISPQNLAIGTFYSGGKVSVVAEFPRDAEIALSCEGPDETVKVMRKGRVCGLWMNVEEVVVHKVPALYLLMTPAIRNESRRGNTFADKGLGYERLCSKFETDENGGDKEELCKQLVALKASDHLYALSEGILEIRHLDSRLDRLVTTFSLPPKAPTGEYQINLYRIKDAGVDLLGTQALIVTKAGLPAYLSSLAVHHGLAYGIAAVVIAIVSGLAVGIVFSSKGAH